MTKRLFVAALRTLERRLLRPVEPAPEWLRRGASITVNGQDIATAVAKSDRRRDTLRRRDEAGG